MYFVYILKSLKDNSFYIGSTGNIQNRFKEHNNGKSRYTKSRRPFELIYTETFNTLSEAKKREYYLKSLKSRIAIEKLIKARSSIG